jgi:predicted tellurium resistance membrane protein TerC
MLALSFLVLIGVALIAEGWGFHIPKGYIYFAMAFALGVEMLNMRMGRLKDSARRRKGITRNERRVRLRVALG